MSNVNFFHDCPCPKCGFSMRGLARESATCANTNCTILSVKHGTQFPQLAPTRSCAYCSETLAVSPSSCYCPNPNCARYMRQQ